MARLLVSGFSVSLAYIRCLRSIFHPLCSCQSGRFLGTVRKSFRVEVVEKHRPLIVHLQIVALLKESPLLDGGNPRSRWFLLSFRSFSRFARTDSKSGVSVLRLR